MKRISLDVTDVNPQIQICDIVATVLQISISDKLMHLIIKWADNVAVLSMKNYNEATYDVIFGLLSGYDVKMEFI